MIHPKSTLAKIGHSYSQNFEDLICLEKAEELEFTHNIDDFLIVDIGASDGITLSNTRKFVEKGFKSILVDSDQDRYARLISNLVNYPNAFPKNVRIDEVFTLINLFEEFKLKDEIGLISIDVDGPDFLILKQALNFKPKIIVIEYNPSIPLHVHYIQSDYKSNTGSSARSIFNFMNSRSYSLFGATQTNLLFCTNQKSKNNDFFQLEDLLEDEQTVKAIWVGYDGAVHFEGSNYLDFPWHGLNQRIRVSGVPKYFRKFFGGSTNSKNRFKLFQIFKRIFIVRDKVLNKVGF